MKLYAVIDTNVIVSALLAKHPDSAPVQVIERVLDRVIVPMFNDAILAEYKEVLNRPKFPFSEDSVNAMLGAITEAGVATERVESADLFPDPKDVVFYEVALSRDDSYLITGNIKHFPAKSRVVTPAQMIANIKHFPAKSRVVTPAQMIAIIKGQE